MAEVIVINKTIYNLIIYAIIKNKKILKIFKENE